MWTALFAALTQFFRAFTVLGQAAEHSANALNHLSIAGEEAAGSFADEARIKREANRALLLKDLKVTEKQLAVAK